MWTHLQYGKITADFFGCTNCRMSPGGTTLLLHLLAILLVSAVLTADGEDNLDEVSFESEEEQNSNEKLSTSLIVEGNFWKNKTVKIRDAVSSAIKVPKKREEIGQVLPIIRNMSPPQKLIMATLISSRISSNESTSPPLAEVRSLFHRENQDNATRDLMLPISMDIAKIFLEEGTSDELPEELPEAQELRLMRPGRGRRPFYGHQSPPRRPPNLNRRNVFPEGARPSSKRPGRRPTEIRKEPSTADCKFFTKTVCLEAVNYPHEAITRSIRGNKDMVAALLTDYASQDSSETDNSRPTALPLENPYESRYENRYENNEIKRRSDYPSPYDNVEEGFTCPSSVMYARPQLARAVSGMWKYIINTGEHTQTLRLEKCSNPKASCSFISENYRSSCTQVYNYHRLLTWDSALGLHMDIFKVPTCCSCHVHGYTDLFPPIQKDPPPSLQESFPGADFATEDQGSESDEFSDRPNSYLTKFKPSSTFDNNFASSSKKPMTDTGSSNRPSFTLPGRRKKPSTASRPFDKLPQQHAPNTRAPGYKGPILKAKRPARPSRPFRRESSSDLEENASGSVGSSSSSGSSSSNSNISNWFSQPYDQNVDGSTRLHNGGFDDEYQEPHRRVNYNYHPIIDFFKPEASMLQSAEPQLATQPAPAQHVSSDNSWKPMYSA